MKDALFQQALAARSALAAQLTSEQIDKAERLAKTWKPPQPAD